MKRSVLFLLFSVLLLLSCKKDNVDGSSTQSFQSSINDMTSSLNTLEQIKFREALYILKTFGVEADGDVNELKALAKLLHGKKVPEIMAMADQVAAKHGVAWSSTGPPSMGDMNIFQNQSASEFDPNDISASGIALQINPTSVDSILGPKAIQVIPRLVDNAGKPISFDNAGLETTLEVYNQGVKLISSKNLMTNNNFRGFTVRFASLPKQKILDNLIDVKVTVKTTKKNLQMTKKGIAVNPKALLMPQASSTSATTGTTPTEDVTNTGTETSPTTTPTSDPKTTVSKFLNNLNSQNLRGAYDVSENPNWGSFETFSNPTSGFGAVKNLSIKNISTSSTGNSSASVNASYDVTDKNGKTTPLQVTFGLKNVNGEWKISSYKIN